MVRTTNGCSALRRALTASGLACAVCLPTPGLAAAAPPLVTILDGPATVLDGIVRSAAAPGQPLADGSIVETTAATQVLRIEWPDGEAVNLGPDTRVMLNPPGFARRGSPGPVLYLLQGWVKHSSAVAAGSRGLVTPGFELPPFTGVVVARVVGPERWLFVQAGATPLIERDLKPASRLELAAGQLYARSGAGPGTVQPRASSAQLQQVPRAFRDTLPARYAQAAAAPPKPARLPAPTYADLQPWLAAEPPVRAGFTRRFARLLRDRGFRRELGAHLADHAEWRPILYPPPPPPPAASRPYGTPAR